MLEMSEFGYQSAIKKISENFSCAEVTVNQMPPYLDYFAVMNNIYAVYIRTENSIRYYGLAPIYSTTLNIRNDFKHLFEVDFMTEMANTFTFEGKTNKKKYATMLFKEFIHDGEYHFSSLEDVEVKEIPIQVNPKNIGPEFSSERDFYANPISSFKRKYEDWLLTYSRVNFGLFSYREATRREIELETILNNNCSTPLLRLLIKLWSIHIIKDNLSQEELKSIEFLNVKNLDMHLAQIQKNIHSKIDKFLQLTPDERKKSFSSDIDNVASKISRRERKLIQRIPLLRRSYGREDFDLYRCPEYKISFWSQTLFYIKAYSNYSVLKYLFTETNGRVKKSYEYAIKGMREKNVHFTGSFFQTLKWIFTLLWTPFICAYFVVSGLTSMPMVFFRKLFGVKLGGDVDNLLTIFESIKDIILLIATVLMGGMIMGTLGSALIGSTMLQIGTYIGVSVGVIICTPFIFGFGPEIFFDKFRGKFPRWTSYNGAKPIFETESYLDRTIFNPLTALMSVPVISVHFFIIGFSFISYVSLNLMSMVARKMIAYTSSFLKKMNSNKFNSVLLRLQIQNLNHSQEFRRLLGALAEKVENSNYNKAEQTILTDIHACMLTENQKETLNRYLDSKLANPDVENKSIYRLAKHNVAKKGYFMSWKLANEIASDNLDEEYSSLATASEQAKKMYHSLSSTLSPG